MTSLAALDAKAAGTDVFGLTNYNKLKVNSDYLAVAGGNLASAATIAPTAEFHIVTGIITIDTITPAVLTPVVGQQVRLLFLSPLLVRNNGGGTGNIRTRTAVDKQVAANEIVTFTYDGTNWQVGDRVAFRTVGTFDLNTSTTKSSLISGTASGAATGYQLPAGCLGINGGIHVRLSGSYLKNDSAGSTAILEIALGNTALFTDAASSLAAQLAARSPVVIDFVIWNDAATNAQKLAGFMMVGGAVAPTTGEKGITGNLVTFKGVGTIDTTLAQFLDVRWTHSVSSAALSIQRLSAFAEVL